MDRYSLRKAAPDSLQIYDICKDHQETDHTGNGPQLFCRHSTHSFHRRINPSFSFLYFTHKSPVCKSILPKIPSQSAICETNNCTQNLYMIKWTCCLKHILRKGKEYVRKTFQAVRKQNGRQNRGSGRYHHLHDNGVYPGS